MRWPGRWMLLAITAALRAPAFAREWLSDDEAAYAVIGRELAHGARLYAQVVDHKPPGIYWLDQLAHRLFGDGGQMLALHVLIIALVWTTALLLGAIESRVTNHGSRVSPLLFTVFTTTMMSFDSLAVNAELLLLLPATASLLLVIDAPVPVRRAFAAGVLLSVAGAFKHHAVLFAPVLLAAVAWPRGAELEKRLAALAAAFVGLIAPWGSILFVLNSQGVVGEALHWFRFNFSYVAAGSSPGELMARAAPRLALAVGPALLLYAAGGIGVVRAWRERGPSVWVAAWAAAAVVAVVAGGRFFGHYFHLLVAPLAVLAAPTVVSLAERRPALVTTGVIVPAVAFWIGALSTDAITARFGEPSPNYAAVVAKLDSIDPARGSICVWGNSPLLVAQSRRPLGCRYVFANYMTGLSPATRSQSDPSADTTPNVDVGSWPRFVEDLETRGPEFIVDGSPGDVAHYGKFRPEKYPELWGIVERDVHERRRGGGHAAVPSQAIVSRTRCARSDGGDGRARVVIV